MKVSGSILSSSIPYKQIINTFNSSLLDYIHLDIMDGKFVNNKSFTISETLNITKSITKPLDIHLMVNNPRKYIEAFSYLQIEYITFHFESIKEKEIIPLIEYIHSMGFKAGISIKPQTDINQIYKYLSIIDLVLIMSVEPGYSGQTFIQSSENKVNELSKMINENKYKTLIEVDGGINYETAPLLVNADILVSASFIHQNTIENINYLKNIKKVSK